MQLMFFTAYGYGGKRPSDILVPDANIRFGVAHLGALLQTYNGDKSVALAAYNGGGGGAKAFQEGRNTAAVKYAQKAMKLYEEYRESALTARPVSNKAIEAAGQIPQNYFKQSELSCKCGCEFRWPVPRLIYTLNSIRESLGRKVIVNSGCRCTEHNVKMGGVADASGKRIRGALGGAKDSNHTHGTAADIRCPGVSANDLWIHVRALWANGELPYLAGLGKYKTFIHVDVAPVVKDRLREWEES
jgi:uncharacterized protein YcbK (DUF882 family)